MINTTAINPFVLNPIRAHLKTTGELVSVVHVTATLGGLSCTIELPDGKWSTVMARELSIEDLAGWDRMRRQS